MSRLSWVRSRVPGRVPLARALAGLLGSTALLAALVRWVGPRTVLGRVAGADPPTLAAGVAVSAVGVALRTVAAGRLYRTVGDGGRVHLVYLSVGVPRNLVPGGYASGPAVAGWLLAREAPDTGFESALAAFGAAEFLALVGSAVVAAVGGLFVLAGASGAGPAGAVAGGAAAVALTVSAAVALARGEALVGPLRRAVGGARSRVGSPPGRVPQVLRGPVGAVRERAGALGDALGVVAADDRTLLLAAGLTALAWLLTATSLWFALAAVGAAAAPAVVVFVAPVGGAAGVAPLPGGAGGVEIALAGLLVVVGGVPAGAAAAAAVLYRLSTAGLEVAVGTAALGVLAATPAPVDRD